MRLFKVGRVESENAASQHEQPRVAVIDIATLPIMFVHVPPLAVADVVHRTSLQS
jgi:hypothetical protein